MWNDQAKAQKILKERTGLEKRISAIKSLQAELDDNVGLIELGEEEGDDTTVADSEENLRKLRADVEKRGIECLLSGEMDGNDAYLQVNSGAGGTESCDWAGMLLRMYMRWADRRGFTTSIMDWQDGDVAGVKSATLEIKGENVFGWLKPENGVHRLVRISPFDANAKRHTSFCSVFVTPVVDDDIEITVDTKDLRVDTYRSSGAGGQHINKTDSAVRLTHLPTGIVVACQNERSQIQNRETAMRMLKAKLYEREVAMREAEKRQVEDAKTDIGWGHQIRSYVLHPYQMIKDLRTGVETSDSRGVLDGDIDTFLESALSSKLGGNGKANSEEHKIAYED